MIPLDKDEQDRQNALQQAINAAYERLKRASISYSPQQGVFVIGRGEECPPRTEGAKPHMLAGCPWCYERHQTHVPCAEARTTQ